MSSAPPLARRVAASLPFGDVILGARSRQVQIQQILAGGLFDVPWYSLQAARTFSGTKQAVADYVDSGRLDGLSPNPLFEPEWFAPGTWWGGRIDPVVRYLRGGWREQSPHPCFSSARWVAEHPESVAHPGGPLGHFLAVAVPQTPVPSEQGTMEDWGELRHRLESAVRRVVTQQELRLPRLLDSYDRRRESAFRSTWSGANLPSFTDGPAVTVVMPVRNRPSQILAAIASVQQQNQSDWELVVVDDGSTDATADVVAHISASDDRIRLVRTSGGGAGAARNVGLAHARGHYVAFLDSDNTWTPDFLRLSLAAMHGLGLRAAYSIVEFRSEEQTRYLAYEGDLEHLLVNNHIDLNSLVVERSLLQAVGGFDPSLRRMIDWDLALRVSEEYLPRMLPFVGVLYYDEDSVSRRISTTESARWAEVVQGRHLIDWSAAAARVPGLTSVVVDTFQDWEGTLTTARSLIERGMGDVDLLVLDDGSRRAVFVLLEAALGTIEHVRVERLARHGDRPLAGNLGFGMTSGDVVVWLKPGCRVRSGWLQPLREALSRPEVRVVAPVVVDSSDVVIEAGQVRTPGAIPHAFLAGHPLDDARRAPLLAVDAVGEHAFAVRATDFIATRGFDSLLRGDLFATDLSLRLGAGEVGRTVVVTASVAETEDSVEAEPDDASPDGEDLDATQGLDIAHFLEVWGGPGSSTAEIAWRDAGFHLAHVIAPTTPPVQRLAPLVVVDHGWSPRGRWVVRVADGQGEPVRRWASSLSAELSGRGLLSALVRPAADGRGSRYLDGVVVHVGGRRGANPGRIDILVGEGLDGIEVAGFDLVRGLACLTAVDAESGADSPGTVARDPAVAADQLIAAVKSLESLVV
ncbi:MAG: glycosyltransferase family 2 protein [Candidatus Nanopelagicales bacterium]